MCVESLRQSGARVHSAVQDQKDFKHVQDCYHHISLATLCSLNLNSMQITLSKHAYSLDAIANSGYAE